MLFSYAVNVPAGTPANNPVKEDLEIKPGVIKRIEVFFPPGCAAKVNVQIFSGEYQLMPRNEGGVLKGDNYLAHDEPYYEIYDEPAVLTFKGWAPNAKHNHEILVYIEVQKPEIIFPELLLINELRRLEQKLRVVPL